MVWVCKGNSVAFLQICQEYNIFIFIEAGTELDGQYMQSKGKKKIQNVMLFDEGALLCFIGCQVGKN